MKPVVKCGVYYYHVGYIAERVPIYVTKCWFLMTHKSQDLPDCHWAASLGAAECPAHYLILKTELRSWWLSQTCSGLKDTPPEPLQQRLFREQYFFSGLGPCCNHLFLPNSIPSCVWRPHRFAPNQPQRSPDAADWAPNSNLANLVMYGSLKNQHFVT